MMEIRAKNQGIKWDEYEPLTPEIDNAFMQYYSSCLRDDLKITPIDEKHLPRLESVGLDFIKNYSDAETTRKYFKNLRFIWVLLIEQRRFQEAEWYLERILRPIYRLEERHGVHIHKGPIYYFWGGTALLLGKLDEGFLLMHKAYDEEKIINEPQPTPSLKFVSLIFSDEKQYFGYLVEVYADYLSKYINPYCLAKGSHYSLDDFRKGFLESRSSPDTVFSFTYTLARLQQLSHFSKHYLDSGFAGQYKLNILFDLTLVIENALRIKHPNYGKDNLLFPKLAEFLAKSLHWNLDAGRLTGSILPKAEKNYEECLLELLDRTFSIDKNFSFTNRDLESDLAIAYLIRNRGAHELASSKTIILRFEHILQSLFNILFLTAQSQYR